MPEPMGMLEPGHSYFHDCRGPLHARVQRSPAIMKVAVPWLQHSHRFGHCALSQTVCNRKSEISALVEKKTGFDGSRTLIQGGLCAWCRAGSIFEHDIEQKLQR